MKNYELMKNYLTLRADLLENTANTLEEVANGLPNHKEITRRLCVDNLTYISDMYSKYFNVIVTATNWDSYRRDKGTTNIYKRETELFSLFDGTGAQPKTTVADLKQALLDRAAKRRQDAKEARDAAERVEATDLAYTEAAKQFKAIVDGMGYDLRQVLEAEHISRF